MSGKKIITVLGSVCAFIFATPLFAAVPLAKGWYLEGLGGSSQTFGKSYQVASVKRTGFAWGANAGYKFMPYFGVEAGYVHAADTLLRAPIGGTNARDRHYAYDIAGKAMVPLAASGAEVFAKLGVARVSSQIGSVDSRAAAANGYTFDTSRKNATGLFAGLGAGYSFIPPLQANLQWERFKGNNSTGSVDFYALGISYILW